jgi:alcohol dehydrogenase
MVISAMASDISFVAIESRTRVVFGEGAAARTGELARELGGERVLLVTDRGVVAAGHAETVRQALEAAGFHVTVFAEVRENPTTRDVDACLRVARDAGIHLFAGVGGGSSLDTAKGCNFLLTNGGRMADYWGVGKATQPMLPLIAVPTTAGTGSELQSFALIADETTHQKMACGDPKAAPAFAVLDPLLTVTQPRRVAACTALDALAHAVETAVTRKRNEQSVAYSHRAFALIHESFPQVLSASGNVDARGRMLLGAAYAGAAIERSMLGAAHAAANPLTAHFGVIHGQAVGMMLPHVVAFNARDAATARQYEELAQAGGLDARGLVDRLRYLLALTELRHTLSALEVPRAAIRSLAAEAARQWTAQFNPRPVGVREFEALYGAAYA